MGVCSTIYKPKNNYLEVISALCTYPRSANINIIKRNDKDEIVHTDSYEFILPDPCKTSVDTLNIFTDPVLVSQCIISGFDPRGSIYKKCQDACIVHNTTKSLFIALFDGHGSEGENVAYFCTAYADKYYKNNENLIMSGEAEKFLIELTESCDAELRQSARINSSLSGW